MSTDRKVTKDLIETLEDGRSGFADAAQKLSDSDRPDLAATFHRFSEQRSAFSAELETLAATYGDDVDEDGSLLGAAHRGWMALKDALAGSDPDGLLDAAEQGEAHAVTQYDNALGEDISMNLRTVVERQLADIRAAHDEVARLRDAAR